MTEQETELRAVAGRLDRLEKQNRRLKYTGAGLLFLAAALVMGQAAPASETIQAQRFVVRDAAGKTRAVLGVTEEGRPGLVLYDAAGKPGAALAMTEQGNGLVLYDAAEKLRAALGLTEEGRPRLVLFDASGVTRAVLGVAAEGPGLDLYDAAGKLLFTAP